MKKFLSLMLTIAIMMSLCSPALATSSVHETGLDLSAYVEVVVFDKDNTDACTFTSSCDANVNDIEVAKAGVIALNLDAQGLGYIQESCLAELDELAEMEGITLNKYSVLIPTSRATTPSYYGTSHGVDFYSAITSVKTATKKKNPITSLDVLRALALNGGSIYFCFNGSPKSALAWTLLTSSYPTGYEVYTGDWIENYCVIQSINRAFYAKETFGNKEVYNREYGTIQPYSVYHSNAILPPDVDHVHEERHIDHYEPDVDTPQSDILDLCYDLYINLNPVVTRTLESLCTFQWLT